MSRYLLSQRTYISARIRAWRGELSVYQVADAAGVSRQTVNNWENGLIQIPNTEHAWHLDALKPGFSKAVRP
jgi:transcriptional regulator with XRE-family HTH domain